MSWIAVSTQFLNTSRDGDSTLPCGQLVPMLHNSFSKEIFPNIQSKPPLTQLEAIKQRNKGLNLEGSVKYH